jgi:hypothetical protein
VIGNVIFNIFERYKTLLMTQDDTIEILEVLLSSVKTRGYKKTLNILKTDTKSNYTFGDYDNLVLLSVCEEFGVSVSDLMNNRYLRGDNKYAIGFCVHYLYSKYTLGEIHKNIFRNKTKTLLSKYRSMILSLKYNEKVSEIQKMIDIKNRLDSKIQTIKK